MALICPTVTAYDPHEYREQIERLVPFAECVHIDLMDGVFAPTKSPGLDQIWWPTELTAAIHLMYQRPMNYLDQLVTLNPRLIVIHYEAEVNHAHFATHLREHGIKAGLAILQDTPVEAIADLMVSFDHVLVFSGDLGHHGGKADLSLLNKVQQIRKNNSAIEIGWDGGIDDQNAKQLVDGGIDVLNVGGFIQKAESPEKSFRQLTRLLS